MSSTNRGGARIVDDVYETPTWAVRRLLDAYPFSSARRFLEPFAATGKIISAFRGYSPSHEAGWTAVELRESCHDVLFEHASENHNLDRALCPTDFFEFAKTAGGYDAIVTNPPFSLAEECIRGCLPLAGDVAMLLRLNFWPHLADDLPGAIVMPLPERPSFTMDLKWKTKRCTGIVRTTSKGLDIRCDREAGHVGEGNDAGHMSIGTDSCEYAWFLWSRNPKARQEVADRTRGRIVLNRTPLDERKCG